MNTCSSLKSNLPKNILHVIRFNKTPLISKYLSKTFQVNEQSPKYSIILHQKQLICRVERYIYPQTVVSMK
jgi:hypothetical protein